MDSRNFRKDMVGVYALQHLRGFITEYLLMDSEEFSHIRNFTKEYEQKEKQKNKFINKELNKFLNIKLPKINLTFKLPKL